MSTAWILILGTVGGIFLSTVTGCGSVDKRAETAAKCASVRASFGELQTRLIESGACDDASAISDCAPHTIMREALVIATKELECPAP